MLTTEKGQILLAYLVLENQQSHSRKKLSTLFWPSASPKSAQNSLRQTLYKLKSIFVEHSSFEQFVRSSRQSIRFDDSSSHWTDVNEFQQLITQRKIGSLEFDEKVQLCERVSRLYRGEFLAGMSIDDSAELEGWLASRRQWFHNQALETLHRIIEAHYAQGSLDLAQIYVDRLLTLDPLNEKAFERKVSILLQKGQSAEANSAYEQFKSHHLQQIGIEPNQAIASLLHRQPTPHKVSTSRSNQTPKPRLDPISTKIPETVTPSPVPTFPLPTPPAYHTVFFPDGLGQAKSIQTFVESPIGKTMLIHGLPGAGKTVLAAEVARLVANDRPVVYLDFKRLSREKAEQIVKQLSTNPVVVLDHLDRLPQLAGLIGQIFTTCDQATVIGVNRLLPKLNRPDTILFKCSGLGPFKATRLISSHAQGELPENIAAQIADQLDGHPAAMLELLRWNQIFPWEMIVQKIQFGEFLWDETPLADWFDTIWQSLSAAEIQFAQRYAQVGGQICAEELGTLPLSIARSAMHFVERGLIKRTEDGILRFQPIFTHWVQAKTDLIPFQTDRLDPLPQPATDDPFFDDQFHTPSQPIGTFE